MNKGIEEEEAKAIREEAWWLSLPASKFSKNFY